MSPLRGFEIVFVHLSTGLHPWLQHAVPSGLTCSRPVTTSEAKRCRLAKGGRVLAHAGQRQEHFHVLLRRQAAATGDEESDAGRGHQPQRTGRPSFGPAGLTNRSKMRCKANSAQKQKTRNSPSENRDLLRVTEGTRTPDPWNHNPVL